MFSWEICPAGYYLVTSRHIHSRNLQTMPEDNSIIIYQSEDGNTRIDVKFTGETVWLSQQQLCESYNTSKANVSEHIKHIFQDGELEEESVVRKFRTTATDGKTYNVTFYNLDMIISLGYRIRSVIATRFRRWATERLNSVKPTPRGGAHKKTIYHD